MPRGGYRPGAGRKADPKKAEARQTRVSRSAEASAERAELQRRMVSAKSVLRDYASQYTEEAICGLVKIARHAKTPPAAKVAAWREVLDRGHGRPPQAITGEGGGPVQIAAIVDELHP